MPPLLVTLPKVLPKPRPWGPAPFAQPRPLPKAPPPPASRPAHHPSHLRPAPPARSPRRGPGPPSSESVGTVRASSLTTAPLAGPEKDSCARPREGGRAPKAWPPGPRLRPARGRARGREGRRPGSRRPGEGVGARVPAAGERAGPAGSQAGPGAAECVGSRPGGRVGGGAGGARDNLTVTDAGRRRAAHVRQRAGSAGLSAEGGRYPLPRSARTRRGQGRGDRGPQGEVGAERDRAGHRPLGGLVRGPGELGLASWGWASGEKVRVPLLGYHLEAGRRAGRALEPEVDRPRLSP